MELKKILRTCLVKMGEQDFLDKEELTATEQDTVGRLVEAFNIGYADAVSEYMPLTTVEKVKVVDGKVECSNLTKQMVYPRKLVDGNGVKHRFRLMPTTILTDFSGEGELEYSYAPDRVELGEEVEDVRFTAEILADCTLAVYYFSLRAFDLASAYDDSYQKAVKKLKYKGREITVKERRWGA